jgi:hypothetical protein
LLELTAHTEADVRARSLVQLARFGAGAGLEQAVLAALGDSNAEVRRAGMAAIAMASLRAPQLVDAVREIQNGAENEPAIRETASATLAQLAQRDPEEASARVGTSEVGR